MKQLPLRSVRHARRRCSLRIVPERRPTIRPPHNLISSGDKQILEGRVDRVICSGALGLAGHKAI